MLKKVESLSLIEVDIDDRIYISILLDVLILWGCFNVRLFN